MSVAPDRPGTTAPAPVVVAVLSDTHGHVYRRVAELLHGVDHIVHAGDVGSADVLRTLRAIAPLTAVRGNVDIGAWAGALLSRAEVEVAGVRFVVTHVGSRADTIGAETETNGAAVVMVSGHTHVAVLEQRGDVLYLNPGSAGPRRFGRPRTIARVEILPSPEVGARDPGTASNEVGAAPRVTAQILTAEDD